MIQQAETLGQIAFETYSKVRNGKAVNGSPIPIWGAAAPEIRAAWEVAAQAVRQQVERNGIQHIAIKPMDIVVISFPFGFSEDSRVEVNRLLRDLFRDQQLLVLEGGASFAVVHPTGEGEHAGN